MLINLGYFAHAKASASAKRHQVKASATILASPRWCGVLTSGVTGFFICIFLRLFKFPTMDHISLLTQKLFRLLFDLLGFLNETYDTKVNFLTGMNPWGTMNPSRTDENCRSFVGISYKSRGVVPSWQKPQGLAQAWQAVTKPASKGPSC